MEIYVLFCGTPTTIGNAVSRTTSSTSKLSLTCAVGDTIIATHSGTISGLTGAEIIDTKNTTAQSGNICKIYILKATATTVTYGTTTSAAASILAVIS